MKKAASILGILILNTLLLVGCSSAPSIQRQSYAALKDERTFETDLPTVWKAIEAALRQNRILERDPEEVSDLELRKLPKRTLKTDWVFSRSKTKYVEYRVNDYPRKTYLQNRFKYLVLAEQVLGGVRVKVMTTEEIQKMDAQGAPQDFVKEDEAEPSLASDLIEKINQALRSAPSL